jgi:hypothetical protein
MNNDTETQRADDQRLRVLQHIDATFRDQIRHTDQKASLVMAFVAALFTVNRDAVGLMREAMVGASAGGWTVGLTTAFFIALFAALLFAFGAIIPRVDQRVTTIFFWRAWLGPADTLLEIERKLDDSNFPIGELMRDIRLLATIIARKVLWLRCALATLYVSILLFSAVTILKTFADAIAPS